MVGNNLNQYNTCYALKPIDSATSFPCFTVTDLKVGMISDALRNFILDYAPGFNTFQKHYLNHNVCANLWAIHWAKKP